MLRVLALLLLFAPSVWGATYYVSNSGSDANSCATSQTISTPKLTIGNFLTNCALAPGDTLYIRGGTYAEEVAITSVNGSAGNLVTISSYLNEVVIIQPPTTGAFTITTSSYLQVVSGQQGTRNIIADCYFTNASTCLNLVGQTGSSNIRIRDMEIKDTGREICGVDDYYCSDLVTDTNGVASGHEFIEFINLWIHGNGQNKASHGMYLTGSDILIENCVIENNAGWGIHKYNIGDRYTIRGNTVFQNGRAALSGDPAGAGEGILIWGGTDSRVYNNVSYGNYNAGITVDISESNSEIYNNTVYGNATGGSNGGIVDFSNDAIIRNNISFGNTGPQISGGATLSNNLTTDPGFVNAAAGDFHLTGEDNSGVAIVGITTDKDGVTRANPPDRGAYEFSGADPLEDILEDFNAYTTSASIDGLCTGTGWSGCWDLVSGTITIETAPAWLNGKAVRINSTSGRKEARRLFTAHTGNAEICYTVSATASVNNYIVVSLLDQGGGYQAQTWFDSSGNIATGAATLQASYTANQAYAICVNIDTVAQPGKYRAKIDGGAYGAWEDSNSAFTSIAGIIITDDATNAHAFWFDDISDVVSGFISGVSPSFGSQGSTNSVTLTGNSTSWVSTTSVLTFSGAGVTAGATTCASGLSCSATVTITAGAASGSRNVIITTGAEVETAVNGFTVTDVIRSARLRLRIR